jgi:hypothetical protein
MDGLTISLCKMHLFGKGMPINSYICIPTSMEFSAIITKVISKQTLWYSDKNIKKNTFNISCEGIWNLNNNTVRPYKN